MKIQFTFLFALISCIAFSQVAESTDTAMKYGTMKQLDSIYMKPVNADSTKSVFQGQKKAQAYDDYVQFEQGLADFLSKNGYKWGNVHGYWNRIYFDGSGKVDYYLYHFGKGEVDEQKEKEFQNLVGRYIKQYQFPLTAKQKFYYCSSVVISEDKK